MLRGEGGYHQTGQWETSGHGGGGAGWRPVGWAGLPVGCPEWGPGRGVSGGSRHLASPWVPRRWWPSCTGGRWWNTCDLCCVGACAAARRGPAAAWRGGCGRTRRSSRGCSGGWSVRRGCREPGRGLRIRPALSVQCAATPSARVNTGPCALTRRTAASVRCGGLDRLCA